MIPPVSHAKTTKRARPCSPVNQLWVPELFPPTCLGKGRTICCGALPPRSPITPDCADDRRVHGKLGSVEERQTVRDDPFINTNSRKKVKILDADVGRHPGSGFSTDPRIAALQREASSSEHPRCRASCTVVATRIEWLATPAESGREGKRAPEAAQEKDPETLKIKTRGGGHGRTVEWDSSHRTPRRSYQCLFSGIQTGPHRGLEEHFLHLC